ncbi:MAG: FAD-dependent oxidoreductase [Bacteroidota bacterium]
MTRTEFLQICGAVGWGLPFQNLFAHRSNYRSSTRRGNVVIIGAGAAGLTAGYILKQQGISFKILEANTNYGGRMKVLDNFVDYPIGLGAEWIASGTLLFDRIANRQGISEQIATAGYTQDDEYGVWYNGKLVRGNLSTLTYRRFVNSSWFGFFEKFIVPEIAKDIQYQQVVQSVDYARNKVLVKTSNTEFVADQVIVTVPIKMLKEGKIHFNPALPKKKLEAINEAVVWDGLKAFIEFKEKFYPAFVDFVITPATDGQVSYYDASFGQDSERSVLGLFAVGEPAKRYGMLNHNDVKNYILAELDEIFSNQATPNYLQHIVQNWSKEPYIEGAYISDYTDVRVVRALQASVQDKVYFAGDCYTSGKDWGNVHNAVESAWSSIKEILD